jgi:nitrogen fixation protein FixH
MKGDFMRIRPFWWILFTLCCVAVLACAISIPAHIPASMQVHLAKPVSPDGLAQITLTLQDPQGLPIEQAQIRTRASMPAMPMLPPPLHITRAGQGTYLLQFHLTMAGQWLITVSAQATGFVVPSTTLSVEVISGKPYM